MKAQGERLEKFDIKSLTDKKSKIAFWCNVYNFFTIRTVIDKWKDVKKSIKDIGGFLSPVWGKEFYKVAGKKLSLDNVEHEIIRPLGDARIHFAINCAAMSCPSLGKDILLPEQLDKQLNERVLNSFRNPEHLVINHEKKTLKVSKIFSWFKKDFVKSEGSIQLFINKFLDKNLKDYEIEYLDYNWDLNKSK
jgi:hypothetical protein